MMAEKKRKNLGRGLSALLGEDEGAPMGAAPQEAGKAANALPVELLHPGRFQPRQGMDEAALAELADSIRAQGILQPILVREDPDEPGTYEIIAGERRWAAAQRAQLHEVPVVVRALGDQDASEIALVENLQRQDLSALEEAEGYRRLMDEFAHTQEQLARAVGKSRSHVANTLRLLNLPDAVKDLVARGRISAGHARALLNADDPEGLARRAADKGLSVRETERLAKPRKAGDAKRARPGKDSDTLALERDVANLLGMKVDINFRGRGGTLVLHYGSLEQLDDLLQRLSHGAMAIPDADKEDLDDIEDELIGALDDEIAPANDHEPSPGP